MTNNHAAFVPIVRVTPALALARRHTLVFQRLLNPTNKEHLALAREGMFPNPQHTPSPASQRMIHEFVASSVRQKLAPPKRTIAFGTSRMFGTTMPKTTVHKYRQPMFAKSEVGFSGKQNVSAPAVDFIPAQEAD